ncbi:MAG: putative signal transducing protein [Terriglobia bacterium]
MPYCAQCLIEYVEGTTRCEDCGADLLPGSPPEAPPLVDLSGEKNVKLVSVRVFNGGTAQMDADLARNILQAQGIPCLLQGEGSFEMLPVLDIPLLVREEDAERAERFLQEYLDTEAPSGPDEPEPAEGG